MDPILSKRESIAATAMAGMLSNPSGAYKDESPETIAFQAVRHADALISQLEETEEWTAD